MIPVTFNKDDLNNPKKGTISPEAMGAMVGLLYPKQVGVLDIFTNPVIVNSINLETTGYVKLTFSKGYVVCYGRLVYVEPDEQVIFELPANTQSGSIGIRINLTETGGNEVTWFMKSGTLQTNDLLDNPSTGVYEIGLYTYTADASTFRLGTRTAILLPSMGDYLNGNNFITLPRTTMDKRLATTQFVNNVMVNALTTVAPWSAGDSTNGTGEGIDIYVGGQFDTLTIRVGRWHTPAGSGARTAKITLPFSEVCYSITGSAYNNTPQSDNRWSGYDSGYYTLFISSYNKSSATYHTWWDRTDCMFIAFGK